jgi:hypothetical protein
MSSFDGGSTPGDSLWNAGPVGPWGQAAQGEREGSFTPSEAPTSYPGDVWIEPACNSRNPGACPPLDEDTSAFTGTVAWGVEKGISRLAGKLAGVPGKLLEAPFESADDRNHQAEADERADREAVETFHQNLAADEAERGDDVAARRGEEQDQRLPRIHPTGDNDPYPAAAPNKSEEPGIGPRSGGAGPTSYPGDVPAEGACESTHPENCPPNDNGWTWP